MHHLAGEEGGGIIIIRQHACGGHPVDLHLLKAAARPAEDCQALLCCLYERVEALQALSGLGGWRTVEALWGLGGLLARCEGNGLDMRRGA